MKSAYSCFIILMVLFLLSGCKSSEEKQKKQALDLMSARTLGLAYLEENKLDEAEKEFLKFIDIAPKEKLGYANLGIVYLRMGKYKESEKILKKAIKIDPKDPDIRLTLSKVYEMDDNKDQAIVELKESLKQVPDDIKTLYSLTELYESFDDTTLHRQRLLLTEQIVKIKPDNIVPRLNLIEMYLRKGNSDKALMNLEEITRQFPVFPREAVEFYEKAVTALYKNDCQSALTPFMVFNNYLKVTSPYQAGIVELKGPGGSLIGFPVITFDQKAVSGSDEAVSILDAISFEDITVSAGLEVVFSNGDENKAGNGLTNVSACDYDGDGDIDLYAGNYNPEKSTYEHFLFKNDIGGFVDVTEDAGLKHNGIELGSKFDDFDNDGYPDLFINRKEGSILYKNDGKGGFENVSKKAGIENATGGNKSLFFDIDNDGDLDLYIAKQGKNLLYRNNSDGAFTGQAENMNVAGENLNSSGAAFGDFDEDGDIDLMVTNENGPNALFSNQRQSLFKDVVDESGLKNSGHSGALAVGDYNNDGFLDLFFGASNGGNNELYLNAGNGKFIPDEKSKEIFKPLDNIEVYDAGFIDFDNDGSLDLLIVGKSKEEGGKGVFLFHNNGIDNFEDVTNLLPDDLMSGRQITTFDYNSDGDIDLIISGINGGIRLLRNDGGNINHYVKIKLVGLRAGSAKNNYFGIGAKVEMRAGSLFQTTVVTDPNVIFGLGSRLKSDIIRITWTNGVPQNIFYPGADQSIVENQVLKGSCPFLYTWNGKEYTFVKDIVWRSALGMPLGIMGGATAYAFPDASDDYIKIPGENLKTKNGVYSIQVTSELWETVYLDKIELVAVDHPEDLDVYVDERFSPPPFPGYTLYKVKGKLCPVKAVDSEGNDIISLISEKDDKYISTFLPGKYQGITEMKELVLDLGDIESTENLCLFLNGWIFPSDASINVALSQSDAVKVQPPVIQVINKKGEWETVISDLSFPMGKDKTIVADLSGKFLSKDKRVRIITNMQIYWDYIFYGYNVPGTNVYSNILNPCKADIHYRGFSAEYRKGGRFGPHWFDYNSVSKETKWRDLNGYYTRYGDVQPLLTEADDKYIISNAGDEISIEFNASKLPELKKGWKRDFMVHAVGWVKDGDINTAFGQTVEPLPFHGMTCYPYDNDQHYPADADHQGYIKEYNTRKITFDSYLNALKK